MTNATLVYCDFIREVSHYLRSPLSVAIGVIDDQLKGYKCSNEDFAAAQDSLKKIKSTLELFKFLGSSSKNPEQLSLRDFFIAEGFDIHAYGLKCCSFDFPGSLMIRIDRNFLKGIINLAFLLLQGKGYCCYALKGATILDQENGNQQTVLDIDGDRTNESLNLQSSSFSGEVLCGLEQEKLWNLAWELAKLNCLNHQLDCSVQQSFEKNDRFNLIFR